MEPASQPAEFPALPSPQPPGLCLDSDTWASQYGACATYAPGGGNHDYCEADNADEHCPAACGLCEPDPQGGGTPAPQAPQSAPEPEAVEQAWTPEPVPLEMMEPAPQPAEFPALPSPQPPGLCLDSDTWASQYGACATYAPGGGNHDYCEADNA